jgi:hypothetical protein
VRCDGPTVGVLGASPLLLAKVPEVGLEPTLPCGNWILSPARDSRKDERATELRHVPHGEVPTVVPSPSADVSGAHACFGSESESTSKISQSTDWYGEGQSRTVSVGDVQITVKFTGRKGRRGRIAIKAPAGAVFSAASDGHLEAQSSQ